MTRRTILVIVAVAIIIAVAVLVQRADYRSGEGSAYGLAAIDNGVVLTSRGTVSRSLGSASLGGQDVLTLRPDCTAEADGEPGTWGQTLLGLRVRLPSRTVAFPFQRLAMDGASCPS